MAGVPGDFTVRASAGDPEELREALEGVPGVFDASTYYRTSVHRLTVPNIQPGPNVELLFIDPDNPPRLWRNAEVAGTLDLPRGSIALSNSLATTLRVTAGDNVTTLAMVLTALLIAGRIARLNLAKMLKVRGG